MMGSQESNFGNWIRLQIVAVFCAIAAVAMLPAILIENPYLDAFLLFVAGLAIAMAAFLIYLYYQFSPSGGGFQNTLWASTIGRLDWDGHGSALDIGTGNGAVAIKLAQRYRHARVLGIDNWSIGWEYSMEDCLKNAAREEVPDRVFFEKASAAALPFPTQSFDAVVSHFVFHEVNEVARKLDVVAEALRVLKKGGVFSLHDMFLDETLYGTRQELLEAVRGYGVAVVHLTDTLPAIKAPRLMQGRRVLGPCAILHGKK